MQPDIQRTPPPSFSGQPYPAAAGLNAARRAAPTPIGSALAGWLRLAGPAPAPLSASFTVRERVRRGRLAAVLLLVLAVIEVAALVQFLVVDDDHPMMVWVLVVGLGLTALAGALNRAGRCVPAALLLVLLADLPLASVPATSFGGRFDVLDLGALYLLVGSLLVAGSVLAPWSVFPVAVFNALALLLTVAVMPHTPALDDLIASNNALQAFAGPVLVQVIVAFVAYLWAQSVHSALRRADRAEELALMEQRELERTHELEEGVRELLAVHVQLANGNFQVRTPAIRNPLLWQIGSSLNNLIARFARLAQADYAVTQTRQDAGRLAEAIRGARAGIPPNWPTPSGSPLDEVVAALAGVEGRSAAPRAPAMGRATASELGRWGEPGMRPDYGMR